MAGTSIINASAGPNIQISGTIQNVSAADTGGLIKGNTGLLQLTGTNTFTGGVNVINGILALGNNTALASAAS